MREINLLSEASKRFGSYRGGQRQRFSLLIATISDPAIVLLDEPTAGLDPQARRQLWDRSERFRKEGRSILLTTHSMEEAHAVCDRVAIMDHGKILTVDTPAALIAAHLDDPKVRQAAHGEVTLPFESRRLSEAPYSICRRFDLAGVGGDRGEEPSALGNPTSKSAGR